MIDTQKRLDEVVNIYLIEILAEALKEYQTTDDTDVWSTYQIDEEDQVDFNIYQPDEDSPNLTVVAYALRYVPGDEPFALQVNTQIGTFVAHIDFERG